MRFRNLAILAGSAAIAVAPVAAEVRSAAPVGEAEELFGEDSNILGAALGVAIGAALVYGLVKLTDDDEETPVSP